MKPCAGSDGLPYRLGETLFFLAVLALLLSHMARYALSFQDENISKTTKLYIITRWRN